MPSAVPQGMVLLVSALTAALAGRRLISAARRWGWASPNDARRAGPGGVPVVGGLAVLIGLAAGRVAAAGLAGAFSVVSPIARPAEEGVLALLFCGFFGIGMLDDRRPLSPAIRLSGEGLLAAGCAWLLLAGGVEAALVSLPAGVSKALGTALLALIVVCAANAFNLADNSDGLAAGVGAMSCAGLALAGIAPVVFLSAAGALTGVWFLNRPPARLYLGDHGSLPLGGIAGLGSAALIGSCWEKGSGTAGLAAALLIAGYLCWDPVYALLGRVGEGRAPWVGGVDHPSHDLARRAGRWPPVLSRLLLFQAISVAAGVLTALGRIPVWGAWLLLASWPGLMLWCARASRRARVDPHRAL
ncbi:MAG: hypothetical protein V1774_04800 [Candidatus Eisenbacteria bacterium]